MSASLKVLAMVRKVNSSMKVDEDGAPCVATVVTLEVLDVPAESVRQLIQMQHTGPAQVVLTSVQGSLGLEARADA